jgi:AraC-like DNA-binding protein
MASPKHEPGISRDILVPVAAALARMGFSSGDSTGTGTDGFVPGSAADDLLDRASAQLKDPALGLTLAEKIPMGSLGILDYALTTSSSLGDALSRVAAHYAIVTQRVQMQLHDEPAGPQLALERRAGIAHNRHWIEFSLALIATRIRETMGPPTVVVGVEFIHPAPVEGPRYSDFFGVPVTFSRTCDVLRLTAGALARPLLTACAAMASLLDAKLRELAPLASDDSFIQSTRRAIMAGLDARDCGLESALARLKMSRRTLQRELRKRGTSHQALLDEIRRDRALTLLQQNVKVAEVAFELGFSEPSAFFKAFHRWTGRTPKGALPS